MMDVVDAVLQMQENDFICKNNLVKTYRPMCINVCI